jgi:hypothetical protein
VGVYRIDHVGCSTGSMSAFSRRHSESPKGRRANMANALNTGHAEWESPDSIYKNRRATSPDVVHHHDAPVIHQLGDRIGGGFLMKWDTNNMKHINSKSLPSPNIAGAKSRYSHITNWRPKGDYTGEWDNSSVGPEVGSLKELTKNF